MRAEKFLLFLLALSFCSILGIIYLEKTRDSRVSTLEIEVESCKLLCHPAQSDFLISTKACLCKVEVCE